MKALITGVRGFCAKPLVGLLSAEPNMRVSGLDIAEEALCQLPLQDYVQADVSDAAGVARAIGRLKPDMIFHLAGASGGSSASAANVPPSRAFQVNTMGAMNVLDAVREHVPTCRVLIVGSAAEYGSVEESESPLSEERPCRPITAYGVSKFAATMGAKEYARRFGVRVVIARPFNIIGAGMPSDLIIGALASRAKQALSESSEPVISAGDLSGQRDFVAVEDVVEAYVRLIDAGHWGEVFNICSGRPQSICEAAGMLLSHSPRTIRIQTDPSLAKSAVRSVFGSFEKAKRAIGFQPRVSLESSLRAVWNAAMAS